MDTDVIVAGAGPAGLALATELRLKGTRVVVVEKLMERGGQSKAMNLHPRTAEMLDLRGLLARANECAMGRLEEAHFAGIPLHYDGLDTRYPYQVGILQARVETVLEQRLTELEGKVRRGWELAGFEQDSEGVTVRGPETLRARYLIGCDGGHSTVRKLLNVAFPGTEPTRFATIADIVLGSDTEESPTTRTSSSCSPAVPVMAASDASRCAGLSAAEVVMAASIRPTVRVQPRSMESPAMLLAWQRASGAGPRGPSAARGRSRSSRRWSGSSSRSP